MCDDNISSFLKHKTQSIQSGAKSNGRTYKKKGIIITNADKGGAVVIMDVEKHIKETNHKLSINAATRRYKKTKRYNTVF